MSVRRWLLTDRQLQEINPLIAGDEICVPGKSFGPHVRNYTLLHYVRSGSGIFHTRGKTYCVKAGEIFVICPGEVTTYTADAENPWHYCWVGFNGQLAEGFRELPAVIQVDESLFLSIFPENELPNPELYIAGGLMRLCARLLPQPLPASSHVQKVKNLILRAYMHPLKVSSIAEELHLDRRYLTRIFRQQTGLSIQQYLIDVRMDAADRHLSQGTSVQDTARLCGYEDSSNFSRLYKRHRGFSPKQKTTIYKKQTP